MLIKNPKWGQAQWHTPLIQHLGDRGRQVSVAFEDGLVYRVTVRTARLYSETLSGEKKKKSRQSQMKAVKGEQKRVFFFSMFLNSI